MGKTTLLRMVILTLVFVTANNYMWGQNQLAYTISFENSATTDASTAVTTTNFVTTLVTSGDSYISSCTATNNTYKGIGGAKLSSSGTRGKFTLALTTFGQVNATKLVVSAKQYGTDTEQIKVNGITSANLTSTQTDYTFSLDGSLLTTISVESTLKRCYIYSIKVYTASSTSQPTLTTSPASLSFSSNLNITSASQAVTVTGTNLTSAPAYTITGTDATQFTAAGTLTTAGGNLDVAFTPTSAGAKSAALEITSGTITKTVALTGIGIDIPNPYNLDDSSPLTSLNETFGDGTGTPATLPAGWKSVSVQGSKNWEMKLYNSNNYTQMSAFGGTGVYQTLLVSPAINFDAIQKNNVKFDWLAGYANGATLKVYVMQKDGTKTEVKTITVTTPATGYATAFTTETIDLSAYSGVKFLVFEYSGNTTTPATTTYQVDNVVASEVQATITITETTIPAMSAEVNATDTKTINVGGSGLSENINLNITGADATMFGVSPATLTLDGSAVPDQFVTITYKPTTAGSHNATLEITSTGADTKTMALTGTATDDVGTGNVKVQQTANTWVANEKIMVVATAGETIEIYNAVGQKLISRNAAEGLNEIELNSRGVHLVKAGSRVAKVVL
ncbi:MAG: hypothetical protein H6Q19_1957 [Bacteroidetes bacterium]|nr:hypothetical protein [Bacteroidota bacterium]